VRFTLDTNVLVYAVDRLAGEKHRIALDIVRRAQGADLVLTLQSLAELFRALTGPNWACRQRRRPASSSSGAARPPWWQQMNRASWTQWMRSHIMAGRFGTP